MDVKMEMTQEEREYRLGKLITQAIAITIVVITVTIASCSIQDHTYEPERIKRDVANQATQASITTARLTSIKKLIDRGVNPVAARCAVVGWKNDRDAEICKTVGISNQFSLPKQNP